MPEGSPGLMGGAKARGGREGARDGGCRMLLSFGAAGDEARDARDCQWGDGGVILDEEWRG